jgi:hypothetical protein
MHWEMSKLKKIMKTVVCLICTFAFLTACGSPKPQNETVSEGTPALETSAIANEVPVPDASSVAIASELEKYGTLRIALYHDDAAFKRALEMFYEKLPGWDVEIIPLSRLPRPRKNMTPRAMWSAVSPGRPA